MLIYCILFLIMNINRVRGDLADKSANTKNTDLRSLLTLLDLGLSIIMMTLLEHNHDDLSWLCLHHVVVKHTGPTR